MLLQPGYRQSSLPHNRHNHFTSTSQKDMGQVLFSHQWMSGGLKIDMNWMKWVWTTWDGGRSWVYWCTACLRYGWMDGRGIWLTLFSSHGLNEDGLRLDSRLFIYGSFGCNHNFSSHLCFLSSLCSNWWFGFTSLKSVRFATMLLVF